MRQPSPLERARVLVGHEAVAAEGRLVAAVDTTGCVGDMAERALRDLMAWTVAAAALEAVAPMQRST